MSDDVDQKIHEEQRMLSSLQNLNSDVLLESTHQETNNVEEQIGTFLVTSYPKNRRERRARHSQTDLRGSFVLDQRDYHTGLALCCLGVKLFRTV